MNEEKIKRFTLRLDQELFEQVKKQAFTNKRAIGKEIEFQLEKNLMRKADEYGRN